MEHKDTIVNCSLLVIKQRMKKFFIFISLLSVAVSGLLSSLFFTLFLRLLSPPFTLSLSIPSEFSPFITPLPIFFVFLSFDLHYLSLLLGADDGN